MNRRRQAQDEFDRLQDTRDDLLAMIDRLRQMRGRLEEEAHPWLEVIADAQHLAERILMRHRVLLEVTDVRLHGATGRSPRRRVAPDGEPARRVG